MHSRRSSSLLKDMVRGLMVESYLVEGSQPENGDVFGQSITDPCMGWNDTVFFVKRLAESM
jgi:3-deoxy-7-phosphoheptulonate synthase